MTRDLKIAYGNVLLARLAAVVPMDSSSYALQLSEAMCQPSAPRQQQVIVEAILGLRRCDNADVLELLDRITTLAVTKASELG